MSSLEVELEATGIKKEDIRRIIVICSDYADKRFEKFRKGRIRTEKARAEELYNMCKELRNARNFPGLLKDIEKKLLEMSTQC